MRFSTKSLTADMYPRPITFITFQVLVVGFGVASILAAPAPIRGPNDSGLSSETDTLDILRSRQSGALPLSHFLEPFLSTIRLSDDSADLSRHIDNPMDVDSGSNFFNGARGRSEQDSFPEHTVLMEASVLDQAEYIDDDVPEMTTTTRSPLLHSRANRYAEIKGTNTRFDLDAIEDAKQYEDATFINKWAVREVKDLKRERAKEREADPDRFKIERPLPEPESSIDLLKLRTVLDRLVEDPTNPEALAMLAIFRKQAEEIEKRLRSKWSREPPQKSNRRKELDRLLQAKESPSSKVSPSSEASPSSKVSPSSEASPSSKVSPSEVSPSPEVSSQTRVSPKKDSKNSPKGNSQKEGCCVIL
ncbi:hypothetical protein FB446DRAFT_310163 [Lentinula raphanica]|nr:hypothetical protein FB446DRAFT_310163 [Lentinula raphanica]